ncbi:hypothetical protein K443DRAFT_674047 [Laccaria amethystina LaAM-08-1]|uniref:Unplaced genomic scaffold K443scaffold_16, whole genome shotgun sequence n=1 Tax=Laccaria amethystina LaAM-08-1 TaxID=1095629 RepID=A0A0C9YF61_9AGAR|nr:hypothetical protein K443DRAFT_674047 [Laccaria amethystina LaAM-08-1]
MFSVVKSLFRPGKFLAPIPNRGIISVFGSQASSFLNGLLSSSIHPQDNGSQFSVVLNAQGRVLYDVFLYPSTNPAGKPGFLLEYDNRLSEAPPLLSYLKRHILRSKVQVRDVSEDYALWASWGATEDQVWETERQWSWARSGALEPVWDNSTYSPWGTDENIIHDRRAVGMGRRHLLKADQAFKVLRDYETVDSEAYLLHRILHGVPEGDTDIPAMTAFPMDSNLDAMGGLDFRKGCYVGQELTVRTYHTGIIRKRTFPVILHKPNEKPEDITSLTSHNFPPNIDIRPLVKGRGDISRPVSRPRGTGKLLSTAQGVGLALLRLEHVAGVQNGDLNLEVEILEGGRTSTWSVSPWWPSWWPRKPAPSVEQM